MWRTKGTKVYNADLRRFTRIIQGAILAFGCLLIAIIAYAGWAANQSATERERILLDNALNQSVARALNEQKSVAWWDDSVSKISDESIDLDFVDANFGIFLTETYGHDEVYIVNARNEPLYAFTNVAREPPSAFERRRQALTALIDELRTGTPTTLRTRPDAFAASQSNYRVLGGVLHSARWAGHLMSIDDHPAVVAALTIVPNVDMNLLRGDPNLLISITYIDDAFISEIGRSLLLDDLTLRRSIVDRAGMASAPLLGDDGILAGHFSWTTKRPGQVLLTIILPLVILAVIATGILSNNMLRQLTRASEELSQREADARHEAKHDALSGLPNRIHMVEKLDAVLAELRTGVNKHVAAAYLDIDRFKDINDTLGHEAGDQLIRAVTQRLKTRLNPEDFLSRFGGDEFAILSAPIAPDGANALAQRVAKVFEAPFTINGQSIRVTVSVGIAVAPEHGTTSDELIRHADIALYEAKNRGRDRAVLFTAEMAQHVEERRAIELDLRAALESNQLRLYYQPVISCRTGGIVGVEALLRWHHPVHGAMSPATFIPIAENAGLLPAIGRWVLDRAMRDSKRWPDLEIAVNLSPVQFRHVDIESELRQLIEEHGIDPSRFVLEITEGVLLEASDHTKQMLDAIHALGFKTALDDFGTGYSSLAYLCNFKFDKIKIDRSFVSTMSKDDAARTIVQSVVMLGRGLGMSIVAEGVETEFEAIMMTHLGCNELQGYYFSRAVTAHDLTTLLSTYEAKRFAPESRLVKSEPGKIRRT
jgi:diguanylate cyclase (GGDEF)-like protein